MTGFSVDWLNLREAADRRARDTGLLVQAAEFLSSRGGGQKPVTVVDLGAGTGSTFRAFQEATAAGFESQTWRLIDNDSVLLAEAKKRLHPYVSAEIHELNLNQIEKLPLQEASLISSSALFDLVSAAFVERLAAVLEGESQQHPLCFYSALNYDGLTEWDPVHPLDATVLEVFNRDQLTDKGFGPALGPNATDYLQQVFKGLGFTVQLAPSPWRLGAADAEMVTALVRGIGAAVMADPALTRAQVEKWIDFRLTQVETGKCVVGHSDFLAISAA